MREIGFYWVKLKDYLINDPFSHRAVPNCNGWCIAYYLGEKDADGLWIVNQWLIGQCIFQTISFEEIGPYLGKEPNDG